MLGCSPTYDDYTTDDACAQIGAAVANKALECTDDADEATRVYESYSARFSCAPGTTAEQALACDTLIHNAACGGQRGFDPADLDPLLSGCDALGLELGPDHGCGALAHRLDLLSQYDGCLPTPDGSSSVDAWFSDTFACSPSDTPTSVRACRDALGCASGTIDLARAIVSEPACTGVVSFATPPDVCGMVREHLSEQLVACGMGAYVSDVASWFDASFACDAEATLQRAEPCFSLSCPWLPGGSISGHQAPNPSDAILKLDEDMYALGCAPALSGHQCSWRHEVERWIFGCTGRESFARETAAALEQTFPCGLQATVGAPGTCLAKLACPSPSDPPSAWADALRDAPSSAGCTVAVEETP